MSEDVEKQSQRLYYPSNAGHSGSDRTFHVDEDCRYLKRAHGVSDCPVDRPPRGSLCDICAPGSTLADLQGKRAAADGGHVTTREPSDPPEVNAIDAATDHLFQARCEYRGGADDEGEFEVRQAAQHLEAILSDTEATNGE